MRARSLVLLTCATLVAGAAKAATCIRAPALKIVAEADMNDNSAVALDRVFVVDHVALPLLAGLSAGEWFEQKAALQNGLATAVQIVALEIPPAMVLSPALPSRPRCFAAVFAFANYRSPGAHRLSLDASAVELRLRRDDVSLMARNR